MKIIILILIYEHNTLCEPVYFLTIPFELALTDLFGFFTCNPEKKRKKLS